MEKQQLQENGFDNISPKGTSVPETTNQNAQSIEPLIYIIEDDKANNFLCKITLEDAGISNSRSFLRAEYALNDLKTLQQNKEAFPALILLDINMPAMDGWGFLNEYRQFPTEARSKTSVLLFSTSDHPRDIEKAKFYPEVLDFLLKPLSEEVANSLKEKYLRFSIPA